MTCMGAAPGGAAPPTADSAKGSAVTVPLSTAPLALVAACLGAAALAGPARAGSWELRVCADTDDLPYSNEAGDGFDNRIASLLAEELDADLTFVWLPDTRGRTRERFVQAGECDMVMSVIDGQPGFLTSHAYYRTGYAFLYLEAAGFEVATLDDPLLRELRIGLPGGTSRLVPPSYALARRGIVANQHHFADRRTEGARFVPVIEALEAGKVDVAIAWGPVAGAYAREAGDVVLAPVRPEIDAPFVPMIASLAIGVRPEDEGLRDDIDRALARSWDRVRAVLEEAGVPLLDLPAPMPPAGEGG